MTPTSSLGPPTRVRYSVLAFLCTLSMITYIDRAFWGSAQEDIRKELGLKIGRRPGHRAVGVPARLRPVRGADRLPGRPLRPAQDAHPHRPVVVVLLLPDDARRLPVRQRRAGRHDRPGGPRRLPVPVRRGRGGGVPEHRAGAVQLVPGLAARHGAGGGVDVGPVHGRADAAHLAVPRRPEAARAALEDRVLDLRRGRAAVVPASSPCGSATRPRNTRRPTRRSAT